MESGTISRDKDSPMRILIAEDDAASRLALAGILRKNGHDVLETETGSEALAEFLKPDGPKLGVIDWMMPEMNGLEMILKIRELQLENPPYLIILTARQGKADIIAGLGSGADDYLLKPFDPGELFARVEVGRRVVEMREELIKSRLACERQAIYDSLTGVLNRRAILDHLHREMKRLLRQGNPVAVGICDIDHFKKVNDKFGHQAGDDVLMGFSRVLTENLREYDLLGRIGGEEFLVVASMTPGADLTALFERLCRKVSESEILTRAGSLRVTVSIGVACAASDTTVDELIEKADAALYKAKEEGRNKVVYDRRCAPGSDQPGL